jgi:Putative peptidoglycan binding domain
VICPLRRYAAAFAIEQGGPGIENGNCSWNCSRTTIAAPLTFRRREAEATMNDAPAHDAMTFSEAQSSLRDLGYYDGPFEEEPSQSTVAALERFQRDTGLQVTERLDQNTADALRDSICY